MNKQENTSQPSDRVLWSRVLKEDQFAFEKVVTKYQNVVAGVAYSLLGNFSWSQEVTQETFWQAWRSRFDLKDPDKLAPWLCGIARNCSHQMLRREVRHATESLSSDLDSNREDPAFESITAEERDLIWGALETIPGTYRETLVLFYRESQSIEEVAVALDVSTDTVKQRLSRGRNLLRESLATKVEEVLVRSRPGRVLTARIMSGVAALATALKATGTVSAAGLSSSLGKGVASGAAAAATKAVVTTGVGAGLAGGLLGAAGGLGGAWLGAWIPPQFAPTMTERRYLERRGKRVFQVSIALTLAIVIASLLLVYFPVHWLWHVLAMAVVSTSFIVFILQDSLVTQREIKRIREIVKPDDDPNPTAMKRRFATIRYEGRRYTSTWKLFGVPLIDIQVSTPDQNGVQKKLRAWGWIAFGDQARGLLFAMGGIACGLIAVGGAAFGGIAIGGLGLGVIGIGGCGIGMLAVGGAAIGYDAVGGGALGWHSAAGGGAVAYHVASGGSVLAHDFAVGGSATANEANTDLARQTAQAESFMWMLEWQLKHQTLFMLGVAAFSLLPVFLLRVFYKKK